MGKSGAGRKIFPAYPFFHHKWRLCMLKRSVSAALVTGTTVIASAAAVAIGGPANAAVHPKAVPNTKPAWTAHAAHLGAASSKSSVKARVYLAPQGGLAALKARALAVSTPGDSAYHKFLSAAQYKAQYAPTASSVQSVEAWLKAAGLKVTGVGAGNRYVSVSGTVAAAEKAFGTQIERYRHKGQDVQAPASSVTVPAAVSADVLTVSGLDTTPKKATTASTPKAPPPAGFRNARPCSLYYGQIQAKYQADYSTPLPTFNGSTLAYAPCGYTGPQFRAAYEGNSELDGSGVTVAITDAYASKFMAKDAQKYAINHGDGSYAPGQYTENLPASFNRQSLCGPSGWYGEEALDVEAIHAMAPAANIRFYASASCFDDDFLDTLGRVVDEDQAQIVSNSWGDVENNESPDSVAAYEQVFLQGAIEGISFTYSSGDNGDELENTGIKQADYPTSDPYVTAVGGTSTAIGKSGNLAWETGWGTVKYSLSGDGQSWNPVGYLYGAGGGESALFNQPGYQNGTVPGAYRGVPDVAMDADPNTGMLIGITQAFPEGNHYDEYRIGGTSLASPLFAGMTALALQSAGSAQGLLNPAIYANQADFTDVKGAPKAAGDVRVDYANGVDASGGLLYSVRTFNQDSSLKVKKGWDEVTGVGSPNTGWLTAFGGGA
jgi:subtilase family serine protease